jgi:fused signal recognition particle receptor
LKTGDDLRKTLRASIIDTLTARGGDPSLRLPDNTEAAGGPAVVLIVGVNGAGKTTTVGKIAHKLAEAGGKVMLGSGDTFRAAAYEQLGTWAERAGATMGPYSDGDTPQKVRRITASPHPLSLFFNKKNRLKEKVAFTL